MGSREWVVAYCIGFVALVPISRLPVGRPADKLLIASQCSACSTACLGFARPGPRAALRREPSPPRNTEGRNSRTDAFQCHMQIGMPTWVRSGFRRTRREFVLISRPKTTCTLYSLVKDGC